MARNLGGRSLDEIKALPVAQLAADDCVLFLWWMRCGLPDAFEVVKAWEFVFKTIGFTWAKQNRKGAGLFMGLGNFTRGNTEVCLIATKGSPRRIHADVHEVVMSPVEEHSKKPEEVRRRIERLYCGPYLELYGRRLVRGWYVFGDEVKWVSEGAE